MFIQRFDHCPDFSLALTLKRFEALRYIGASYDPTADRWVAKFCASRPAACTLDAADLDCFLELIKQLLRTYRAACDKGCPLTTAASLDMLFWTIFDLAERSLDLDEENCVCPMEWRVHRVEGLGPMLIDIALALGAIDAEIEPIAKALDQLACATTNVHEQQQDVNGTYPPFVKDCPSLAARADRLAMTFFNTVNDLRCNNWPPAGW